jgi:LAO/AO transport system kinase
MTDRTAALLARMLAGDRIALAKLITLVENRAAETAEVMSEVHRRGDAAAVVGITGPPGAGKSTLVDALIAAWRGQGHGVGVVAVDPSSPFSGGAVLGDRIRMQAHFLDEGVFIRSLSARGSKGGLARAARDVTRLLAAFGKDHVVVETVGVGQNEFEIMRLAQTVVVVLVPEAGDTIQAMKAGLLEIADVFVVNKADREGAARMKSELQLMLQLRPGRAWQVPVLLTVASEGRGVDELVAAIAAHQQYLAASGEGARREAAGRHQEFADALRDAVSGRLERALRNGAIGAIVRQVERGEVDPYAALARVLADPALLRAMLSEPEGAAP